MPATAIATVLNKQADPHSTPTESGALNPEPAPSRRSSRNAATKQALMNTSVFGSCIWKRMSPDSATQNSPDQIPAARPNPASTPARSNAARTTSEGTSLSRKNCSGGEDATTCAAP
jgi:hypothetical protein